MAETTDALKFAKDAIQKNEEILKSSDDTFSSEQLAQLKQLIVEVPTNDAVWTPALSLVSAGLLIITGFVVLYIANRSIGKAKDPTIESILKLLVVPLIVICGTMLIVVGFGEKQVAPAFGLMGTIVGFLLAKDSNSKIETEQSGKSGPGALNSRPSPSHDNH
ncbi:hypothetical protein MLD52_19540 [Puniceicoccaceae bacterium K14]|nr:hypothetical protein [Puniceicoccaceae bacterium K14]